MGAPVIGDLDGEYKHDSRRNILEWSLPLIDASNKTGSLEFSVAGQPNDFFPVNVSFVSKRNYCDIQVGWNPHTRVPERNTVVGKPLSPSSGRPRHYTHLNLESSPCLCSSSSWHI